ncbi:protein YIPF6 isoform X3 [Petaurus breviceps papuanus]|uniref:protein YIPF6 isoform X3 n=1 Tax=Petaurus breviceps papuanus TaxID=3040969 RepID=UPI0036DCA481
MSGRWFLGLSDVSISEDIPVEGEITVPMASHSQDEDYSTLDEPVKETIIRDLKAVGKKFVHVMYPKKSNALLRDWDLWGPLVLCVSLALMLQGGSADSKEDGGPQFAEVFVIIWFGAVVITLNSKLLGGTISFFQSLCVLGYCVLPLTVAMLVCRLVLLAGMGPINFLIRLIVVIAMFAWSTLDEKRNLEVVTPIGAEINDQAGICTWVLFLNTRFLLLPLPPL